ncbi:hypothetical protein Goshw_018609 [Gossypium schwendimanii]|uniref:Uncharacterized protein n=1 Tax=Gossypium schwendimanii TaxID=34291 RepID=A0A7J9L485_GOSSC|nr:hypothetical protein [Gossypium schwendimanii]
MHVNVNITRCRRAKKMVMDKLAENFVHEFAKNPRSTIKMAVDRVTPESPPHFKRDGNNQIYPVAWAIVEGDCIDSWAWFLSLLTTDLRMEDGSRDSH